MTRFRWICGRVTLPDQNIPTPFKEQDGKPVFEEAWQAEVLAIAQSLIDNGSLSGTDWANALGTALRSVQDGDGRDNVVGYYDAALMALENVVQADCDVSNTTLNEARKAWVHAYETTPHGAPVILKSAPE